MNSKKLIVIPLLLSSAFALVACNSNQESSSDTSNSKSTSSAKTEEKTQNTVYDGEFKGLNEHSVEGQIKIENDQLTFSNFSTDEGPDLHVYLAKGNDVTTGKQISKIDLKEASQTFDLSSINADDYDTILIYCNQANVAFGAAEYNNNKTSYVHPKLIQTSTALNKYAVTVNQSELKTYSNSHAFSNLASDYTL